jgi:K+-transporting ATPase ATPase C chain
MNNIRANFMIVVLSLVICCVAYPLALWAFGQAVFPSKANGSLVTVKGPDGKERVVGSKQIAQPFTSDEYFWPRPSAASFNGAVASGSNWGANNPKLRDRAAQQLGGIIKYKKRSDSAGKGAEPRTPQQDMEEWFAAKDGRSSDWASEYGIASVNWAKTDLAKDKYGLQGEYILAWAKDHPEIVDEWKKANPSKTDDPKPEDLVSGFFTSFASIHPRKWPGVVEVDLPDKTKEKRIEPVSWDSALVSLMFDMWLQDPANRLKVADLEPVPADMVTASGAGLDPHITVRNAMSVYQIDRVAAKRTPSGGDVEKTRQSIAELLTRLSFMPLSGLVGEPLVNVLELNIELDAKWPVPQAAAAARAPEAVAEVPQVPAKEKEKPAPIPAKMKIDLAAVMERALAFAERGDKSGIDELKKATVAEPTSARAWSALGQAHLFFGQFRPAAFAFRNAAERSPADSAEHRAAESAARDAMRWAGLERHLPSVLSGAVTPMSPPAWADFGEICDYTRRHAAAARFFAKAAEGDNKYVRRAAICAALAGFNRGSDAKDLTEMERLELRRSALAAFRTHPDWAQASALSWLKDPAATADLDADERTAWRSIRSAHDNR